MNAGTIGLVSALALAALAYIGRWWALERGRGQRLDLPEERTASARARRPRFTDALVGFITNFFDTLGIRSFAPTTAYFKLSENPGTREAR